MVRVPEEKEDAVTPSALPDGVEDVVGNVLGPPARQGYEEATGDEVAAEREYGHRRTALDFLLTGEHACGATAHHLRRPAHLARGAGDAREAGPVWRSREDEQHIGALEARRGKCCGGRIGRGARRISLCRQSRSRPKHTPFSGNGPLEQAGAGIATARARKMLYRAGSARSKATSRRTPSRTFSTETRSLTPWTVFSSSSLRTKGTKP